jgi:hypothetical protein
MMKIFDSFKFKPDKDLKDNAKSIPKILPWTIYNERSTQTFAQRFIFFHYFLKYRIIVPLLNITRWFIDRKMCKFNIPSYNYNRNIRVFNEAFIDAKKVWVEKWGKHTSHQGYTKKQLWKAYERSLELVDTAFEGYMRLCLQDTAYREFHNILMHKIAKKMLNEYKDKKPYHVFYNSHSINDMKWLITVNALEDADTIIHTKHNTKAYAKRV